MPVYAQCPVCVITVGGGLFIANKLGIDDLLVSIWLSSLNTAIAFWFAGAMKNKLLKNGFGWTVAFYIITIGTLVYTKQIGHRFNTFLGIDKIIAGLTLGFIISFKAIWIDRLLRKKNHGKVFFPYQKVIIPLAMLIVSTGIFYYLISVFRR